MTAQGFILSFAISGCLLMIPVAKVKAEHSIKSVDGIVSNEKRLSGHRVVVRGYLQFGDDSRNLWADKKAYVAVRDAYVPPDDPAWNRCLTIYGIGNHRDELLKKSGQNVAVTGLLKRITRGKEEVSTNACSELGVVIQSIRAFPGP